MAFPEGAPNKSAVAEEWIEFAINRCGVPSYEARNMTKDDLMARLETADVKDSAGATVNPGDLGPGHGVGSYLRNRATAAPPEPVEQPNRSRRHPGRRLGNG